MNDKLAATDVDLERERFDDLCKVHSPRSCIRTVSKRIWLSLQGLSAERKQMPHIVES